MDRRIQKLNLISRKVDRWTGRCVGGQLDRQAEKQTDRQIE